MTGKPSREPFPLEKIIEYRAEKAVAVSLELLRAYERACREHGIIQEVIAARLGKDKGRISRILRGAKNWTTDTLADMALAMDCDLQVQFVHLADKVKRNYAIPYPEEREEMVDTGGPRTAVEKLQIASR